MFEGKKGHHRHISLTSLPSLPLSMSGTSGSSTAGGAGVALALALALELELELVAPHQLLELPLVLA